MNFTAWLAKKWTPYALLALFTAALWGHTVRFGFVWDDAFFIRNLPAVRSVTNIPSMFTSIEAQAVEPYRFRVFRPLRTAHYAVLYALSGQQTEPQPQLFHLANVVWHGATAMMLFAAFARLLPRLAPTLPPDRARLWALFVALGFVVNPVTSEVVCWAKSLDDILATFFTLACLHQLLAEPADRAARWRALLFCALACYAKESAVPLAVLPFFIARGVHGLGRRAAMQFTLPFIIVTVVYMAHRGYIIERQSQVAPISGSYVQTLVDMGPVVTGYARLLCGIPPFFADYKFMHGGLALTSPAVLTGFALLAALTAFGWFCWHGTRHRLVGFGLLWTGLFLLPVSNLLPMMQYMAERFLYLPLAGWLMALAGVLVGLRGKRIVVAAALVVLAVWSASAWNRSWVWQDELALFTRSYLDAPGGERMAHNTVAAILQLPHVQPYFGLDEKTDALRVRPPTTPEASAKLISTFTQAAELMPHDAVVQEFLGISLAFAGRPADAVAPLAEAARLRPRDGDCQLNLARALKESGQLVGAQKAVEAARAIAPKNASVLQQACEIYWLAGDLPRAHEAALQLCQYNPSAENSNVLEAVEKRIAQPESDGKK